MRRLIVSRVSDGENTYADLWIKLLQMPANGESTSLEEMRRVVPVIEKLEAFDMPEVGHGEVILEDAEWKELESRLTSPIAVFQGNNREALDMIESVIEAPVVTVDELKETG